VPPKAGNRLVACGEQFAVPVLAVTGSTAVEHVVRVDGKPEGAVTLDDPVADSDRAFGFQACCRPVKPVTS